MKADVSVFEGIKREVDILLSEYPSEKVVEAVLFVVDKKAIKELDVFSQRLIMEYSGDEAILKKHDLSNIVKVLNPHESSNWYRTFETENWKQVNDKEKVLLRLDSEFSKYKNKIKSFTKKKIKDNKIAKEQEALIMKDIDKEIVQAQKELDFIQENFDDLDVRVSTYNERTKNGAIQYLVNKKRKPNEGLRKQVPNVLWFEELSPEEKTRDDNELQIYLSNAKRAFGDVYYVALSKYRKKPKQGDNDAK